MMFILVTENTQKCYQAPFPIFRAGLGNEAMFSPHFSGEEPRYEAILSICVAMDTQATANKAI